MKRRGIAAAVIASCLIIASVSAAALFYTGILKPVNPRESFTRCAGSMFRPIREKSTGT